MAAMKGYGLQFLAHTHTGRGTNWAAYFPAILVATWRWHTWWKNLKRFWHVIFIFLDVWKSQWWRQACASFFLNQSDTQNGLVCGVYWISLGTRHCQYVISAAIFCHHKGKEKKTCKLWEITKNVSYISCFLGIMWGSNCIVYSHVPSFAFHFSLPSKIFVRNGPFCWVASCLEISKLEVSSVLPNKKYCWCSNLDCFLRWPGHSCWCGNLVSPATERSAGNIRESKSKVILY